MPLTSVEPKGYGSVHDIISCLLDILSVVFRTAPLPMSLFHILRLQISTFSTTHSYGDSIDFERSTISVFFSIFVSSSKLAILLMSSLCRFNIRLRNNINSFRYNGLYRNMQSSFLLGSIPLSFHLLEFNQQ